MADSEAPRCYDTPLATAAAIIGIFTFVYALLAGGMLLLGRLHFNNLTIDELLRSIGDVVHERRRLERSVERLVHLSDAQQGLLAEFWRISDRARGNAERFTQLQGISRRGAFTVRFYGAWSTDAIRELRMEVEGDVVTARAIHDEIMRRVADESRVRQNKVLARILRRTASKPTPMSRAKEEEDEEEEDDEALLADLLRPCRIEPEPEEIERELTEVPVVEWRTVKKKKPEKAGS